MNAKSNARQQEPSPRDWTRCAYCWRPRTDSAVIVRGRPYCDERCASGEAEVALDGVDFDSGEQLDLLAPPEEASDAT